MAMNKTYLRASDLPEAIPLFPLSGAILLPGGQLPLNIFEPRYLAMFDDAMRGERIIGIVQPAGGDDAGPAQTPVLRPVGAAGRITQLSETGDGRYFVVLSGIARFRLVAEIDTTTPYRQARVDFNSFRRGFRARGNRFRRNGGKISTPSPSTWPRRCGSISPARISKPCPILT